MPPEPTRPLPRRAMLAVSGTAVLAAAAACSSANTATGTTAATSPASSNPATSSGRASASSASSPASPTVEATTPAPPTATAAPSEPAPGGTPVASVADVQAAGSIVVGENENAYLLAFTGDTVVAHTAVCTHQRCTVGASGLCPCHQSRFDVATGGVIDGPALRPLAERAVTVSGGQVYLA